MGVRAARLPWAEAGLGVSLRIHRNDSWKYTCTKLCKKERGHGAEVWHAALACLPFRIPYRSFRAHMPHTVCTARDLTHLSVSSLPRASTAQRPSHSRPARAQGRPHTGYCVPRRRHSPAPARTGAECLGSATQEDRKAIRSSSSAPELFRDQ